MLLHQAPRFSFFEEEGMRQEMLAVAPYAPDNMYRSLLAPFGSAFQIPQKIPPSGKRFPCHKPCNAAKAPPERMVLLRPPSRMPLTRMDRNAREFERWEGQSNPPQRE